MKEIIINVHIPGESAPRILKMPSNVTAEDLLRNLYPENHADFVVVLGNSDRPLAPSEKIDQGGNASSEATIHAKIIHFTVDGEPETTSEHKLTAKQVLDVGKIDSAAFYLILLKGDKKQESYKDRLIEIINMHEGMEFITAALGPTPVS